MRVVGAYRGFFAALVIGFLGASLCVAAEEGKPLDLRQAGPISNQLASSHVQGRTYNLGPTGMRGWIPESWGTEDISTQILVTTVDAGSPADGMIKVGDVILGVLGKPFVKNTRLTFAKAIDVCESEEHKGVMPLIVWRDGNEIAVKLQLNVMGSYSDTAPYNCAKSARILEQGCDYIVRTGNNWGRFNLEGLVLLASGKKEYLAILEQRAAEKAAAPDTAAFIAKIDQGEGAIDSAWNGGYGSLFWTEYYLATGDARLLPWIRANAINVARGQGMWGTYGHGFSLRKANGDWHGMIPPYGALNQSGLACFLSMVMARKAGVRDKDVAEAIERANKFFEYYTGKGTIPYGEHRPEVWQAHNNNGSSALAAHAFAAQGNHRPEAQFWGKMCTAGYRELEHGHAGPFFSYLWGTLGASVAGPRAAAAYFKEIAWHYDLERRWDGSFAYTPVGGTAPEWSRDNRGISATGAYLLTFALPKRQVTITGRKPDKKIWINDREVARVIGAGRFDDANKSVDTLLASLGSWSPAERVVAARELARRDEDVLPRVVALAEGGDINACVGACHVLAELKDRALPALPLLIKLLAHDDPWVRVQAAEALRTMGEAARPAVAEMLKAIAVTDLTDPLRFGQGSLCYTLFYPGGHVAGQAGLLAKSIEGVDRELLYPAIRAVAIHPDGHARGCLRSTYTLLTLDDIKALMPDIVTSIIEMADSNTMFSKGCMLAGVRMLADHRVAEGLTLGMSLLEMWRFHGRGWVEQYVTGEMKRYGASAKPILPRLKAELEKCPGSGSIKNVIEAIESSAEMPELISLNDYMGKYKDQYRLDQINDK